MYVLYFMTVSAATMILSATSTISQRKLLSKKKKKKKKSGIGTIEILAISRLQNSDWKIIRQKRADSINKSTQNSNSINKISKSVYRLI